MLRNLTVQNYRCFKDFQIDGLKQVNLFVGNNNSGKTSLLEAIYLLVNPNKAEALTLIVENRSSVNFQSSIHPFIYIKHNLPELFYQEK